jgi:hypothetical protein
MKKIIVPMAFFCCIALTMSACGGGGSSPAPTTKVVLKAFLFGTMSSATANVTTVHASMKVPSGVFVNYSTPAPSGYPPNTYNIRSGSITPSGALLNNTAAMVSGTYNTSTFMIDLQFLNAPTSGIPNLKSSPIGNGTEFATLYFKLAATDSNTPFDTSNPSVDLKYDIEQSDLSILSSGVPAKGCTLKFTTTYQ